MRSLRPLAGRIWQDIRGHGSRRRAAGLLSEAVAGLPPFPGLPDPGSWRIRRIVRTETHTAVVIFGTDDDGDLVVGRIGPPGEEATALVRNHDNLVALLADQRLGDLHPLLPAPLAIGRYADRRYALERMIPGSTGQVLLRAGSSPAPIMEAALTVLRRLHEATAAPATIEDDVLHAWMAAPLHVLETAVGARAGAGALGALHRIEDELRNSLRGQECRLSWVHGDMWAGNLLFAEGEHALAGIIDWDAAMPCGLPATDVLLLLLATREQVDQVHFGSLVAQVLTGGRSALSTAEWDAAREAVCGVPGGLRIATILTWLGHLGAVLTKEPAHAATAQWLAHNVDPVLEAL